MKAKNKYTFALILLFIIVLGIRLNLAFRYTEFNDDEAYFVMRQVENIRDTWLPLYQDPLSYGGREYMFLPTYHYFLAFFSLFMPLTAVLKIIPNLFASATVIAIFFLSYEITKNRTASFFSAMVSGFIPVFLSETVNSASLISAFLFLGTMLMYYYIKQMNEKKFALHFIITATLLTLLTPLTLVFIIGIGFHLLLCAMEKKEVLKREVELFLFFLLFYLWLMFVIFKKTLVAEGTEFIWRGIPSQLVANYFTGVDPLMAIYSIGALPLLFGIYVVYERIFEEKNKAVFAVLGILLSASILSWLKLIENRNGLIISGLLLSILFSDFIRLFLELINKTKFSKYKNTFLATILILILLMSCIPALDLAFRKLREKTPQDDVIKALNWINDNTEDGSIIVASPSEGHKISFISKRKNVMDSNYNMAKSPEQRFKDIRKIFTTISKVEALELCERYDITYIYFSENTILETKQKSLSYIDEKGDECFQLVYDEEPLLYKVKCKVRKTE
jgi:hypothetical protein